MRSTKVIATGLFLFLLATLLITAGCAKAAKEAAEKKTGVEVETEKEKPLKKVDISDIPRELIYSNSKATERVKVSSPRGETVQVTLVTSDNLGEVKAHYDKEPVSAGWNQQMKVEQETTAYTFTKDKSWVTISIIEEEGKVNITVHYLKEIKQQ